MCCFRRALFLTFITITAISESSCSEKSSNSDLSGGGSLEGTSELLSPIRTRRKSLLSETELKGQLELAKVNGLKRRFKRFSCWHSCFGPLYRKVVVPNDIYMPPGSFTDQHNTEEDEEEVEEVEVDLVDGYGDIDDKDDAADEQRGGVRKGDGSDVDDLGELPPDIPEETQTALEQRRIGGSKHQGTTRRHKGPDTKRRFQTKSGYGSDVDDLGDLPPDMSEETQNALESKRRRSFDNLPHITEDHVAIKKRAGLYPKDGDFDGLTRQRKLVSASHPDKSR